MVRRDYTKPETLKAHDQIEEIIVDMDAHKAPEKRKKIFISLPMSGRDETDILDQFNKIADKFKENYDVIDQYHQEEDPNGINRYSPIWYLGHSIQLMRTADLVVFSRDWFVARGCIIEHRICEYYDLPHLELRDI